MMDENKKIYFDQELPLDECPKPDAKNFVKQLEI